MNKQPVWISVKDRLPEKNGDYYVIHELQHDVPIGPKGMISISISETWCDGSWYDNDENWKVIYWAEPVKWDVPEEISDRPRLGCILQNGVHPMKGAVKQLSLKQINFICKECKITLEELYAMDDDALYDNVYDVMCDIEIAETPLDDSPESERCSIASDLVTILGNTIIDCW